MCTQPRSATSKQDMKVWTNCVIPGLWVCGSIPGRGVCFFSFCLQNKLGGGSYLELSLSFSSAPPPSGQQKGKGKKTSQKGKHQKTNVANGLAPTDDQIFLIDTLLDQTVKARRKTTESECCTSTSYQLCCFTFMHKTTHY